MLDTKAFKLFKKSHKLSLSSHDHLKSLINANSR